MRPQKIRATGLSAIHSYPVFGMSILQLMQTVFSSFINKLPQLGHTSGNSSEIKSRIKRFIVGLLWLFVATKIKMKPKSIDDF
jgi:hypothetical protein